MMLVSAYWLACAFAIGALCLFLMSLWQLLTLKTFRRTSTSYIQKTPGGDHAAQCFTDRKEGSYDAIVVGAGLAGCTVALQLAEKLKLKLLLVEKKWVIKPQDSIVGELMQPAGMLALEEMGLHHIVQSEISSVPQFGYVVCLPNKEEIDKRTVLLNYPPKIPSTYLEKFGFLGKYHKSNALVKKETVSAEHMLDFCASKYLQSETPRAYAFHNVELVLNLRKRCSENALITCVEASVLGYLESSSISSKRADSQTLASGNISKDSTVTGIEYECYDPNTSAPSRHKVEAALTLLCDGGQSMPLRRNFSNTMKSKRGATWLGLLLKHKEWETPLLPGYAQVMLLNPNPIICYQIAPSATRCLIPVTEEGFVDYVEFVRSVICPQLPEPLKDAVLHAVEDGQVAVKNSYVMTPKIPDKFGVIALGDSLNMRNPITGSGMTVCLKDVQLAISLLDRYKSNMSGNSKFIMSQLLMQRGAYGGTLNILADALFSVFSFRDANEEFREYLTLGCLKYLKAGDVWAYGPMGLLSGLSPDPNILLIHFFLVVWEAIRMAYSKQSELPLFKRLKVALKVFRDGVQIVLPLVAKEQVTIMSSWPILKCISVVFDVDIC